MAKLTPAQLQLLGLLRVGPRIDISNESVVKALARKGLAERFVDRCGYLSNHHGWKITEAGRTALQDAQGRTR